jgi:CubicO group peptidase (beta-lactamase class C family)
MGKISRIKLKAVTAAIITGLFFFGGVFAQNPQESWQQYKTPEEAGFSSAKLAEARALYDTFDMAAFMVVYKGKVAVSWGDVTRRYMCHSVRKSLLSALYGIHVDAGTIDLNTTLEALKIDDIFPLSKEEKQARIIDLLKARSGVYHPAAYETQGMKKRRPKRGSHKRDTFWYYNNWDFNALCAILIQVTGTDFFEDFKNRIADPLQMEDFRLIDCNYHLEPENSRFPAYPFRLSARDLARLGQLFLQEGKWNNKQVISQKWINESTTSYSGAGKDTGYGYLWWTLEDFKEEYGKVYTALGVGSQVVAAVPSAGIVIVQRVDTYKAKRAPLSRELIKMILAARTAEPKPNPQLIALQSTPSHRRPVLAGFSPEELQKYIKEYPAGELKLRVKPFKDGLLLQMPFTARFRMLPVSRELFLITDREEYGLFEFDNQGRPVGLTLHLTREGADFYSGMMKVGVEAAVKAYKEKIKRDTGVYKFEEFEIYHMGHQLLEAGKAVDGIEVFKLGVDLHPKAFYLYYSLAGGYLLKGETKKAIVNLKKSLALNPRHKAAEDKLKELEKTDGN